MYVLGATLTKFVGVLTAVMTVVAGLPTSYCRCPDGRVKLFCQGISASSSGCCCAAESSRSPNAEPCCCGSKQAHVQETKGVRKRSCCAPARGEESRGSGGDGPRLVVKAGCCVMTVAAAPAVDSVVESGHPLHPALDTLALGVPAFAVSHVVTADSVAPRPPPGGWKTPTDLVVVLCRFLC